jgi:hypothetical protein
MTTTPATPIRAARDRADRVPRSDCRNFMGQCLSSAIWFTIDSSLSTRV